jgi:hypothetical protein
MIISWSCDCGYGPVSVSVKNRYSFRCPNCLASGIVFVKNKPMDTQKRIILQTIAINAKQLTDTQIQKANLPLPCEFKSYYAWAKTISEDHLWYKKVKAIIEKTCEI